MNLSNYELLIILFLSIFACIALIIIVIAIIELIKGRHADREELTKMEDIRKNPIILNLDIESSSPVTINGKAVSPVGGKCSLIIRQDNDVDGFGADFESLWREGKAYFRQVEAAVQGQKDLAIVNKDHHLLAIRDGNTVVDLSIHNRWGRVYVFLAEKNGKGGRYAKITLDRPQEVERAVALIKSL